MDYCVVLSCVFTFWVVMSVTFPHKTMFGSFLPPMFVGGLTCYLRYLCLLYLVVLCLCFAFPHLVYPMLPVSLDYPFVIALSVFSGLSICDCPLGILWIIHLWLPSRYSLDYPFVIALSVFSGLSICDCPLGIL
jgi:hypothetical protein